MTSEHSVDEFLRAEDEASSLLDELARLRAETESYTSARGALNEAAQGLKPLTDRLSDTAKGVQSVSATLRDIGTPELSAGLARVADDVTALNSEFERQVLDLKGSLASLEALARKSIGDVASLRSLVIVIAFALVVGLTAIATAGLIVFSR